MFKQERHFVDRLMLMFCVSLAGLRDAQRGFISACVYEAVSGKDQHLDQQTSKEGPPPRAGGHHPVCGRPEGEER